MHGLSWKYVWGGWVGSEVGADVTNDTWQLLHALEAMLAASPPSAEPCGVVCCGALWCAVVRCGVVRCGVVWCGVVWCGVVWCDVACGVV